MYIIYKTDITIFIYIYKEDLTLQRTEKIKIKQGVRTCAQLHSFFYKKPLEKIGLKVS